MEAFSLLRYWKSSSSSSSGTAKLGGEFRSSTPTTIVAAVNHLDSDTDSSSDDDDGPFFDLEFAVPQDGDGDDEEEDEEEEEERQKVEGREIDEEEVENNLSFSPPSDELFFKGNVVRFDGSDSTPLAEMEQIRGGLPASLAKSAARVRVFMLGLKRSKSESKQISEENQHSNNNSKNRSKLMRVRLKMEEMKVPKISLLTRATSNAVKNSQTSDEKLVTEGSENNENEKKVVQKYLKLVRPLYVKVSKKSNNDETAEDMEATTVKSGKQRFNLKKHLGKSKSAVVHSLSSRSSNGNGNGSGKAVSNKTDDSLLQQQDGIQSAILHCKRSFNSSSQDEDETISVLLRSTSDPSHENFTTKADAMVDETAAFAV